MPFSIKSPEPDILKYLKGYPFATLVTINHRKPVATQLPFLVNECDGQLCLYALLPKTNKQWKHLEFEESLVIFQEPPAYVSPFSDVGGEFEGTASYQAIHVYGNCKIIHDQKRVFDLMERMSLCFDNRFLEKWENLSADDKANLAADQVAFEMKVTDLQPRESLSQKHQQKVVSGQLHL